MENKNRIIIATIFLNIILLTSFVNIVRAQDETDYPLVLKQNDELVWEVTELDEYYFKNVFGTEPNYEKGDKIRMIITDIYEGAIQWSITTETWDYKREWGERGETQTYPLYKNPIQYDDYIFILTPVEDYLEEALTNLPTEYSVSGASITKIEKSRIGVDYRWEKQFDSKGVLHRETIYDFDDPRKIVVRVEGGYRIIPMGPYFLTFTFIALFALIVVSLRSKKFNLVHK